MRFKVLRPIVSSGRMKTCLHSLSLSKSLCSSTDVVGFKRTQNTSYLNKIWTTTLDLLSEFYAGKAELHFPQFYLLSCFSRFSSFSNFLKFSFETNRTEKQLIMPVRLLPRDGEIGLLPGDDFYPKDLDYITPFSIVDNTKSIESFPGHHMHRMVVNNESPHLIKMVTCNIEENTVKSILPWYPDCPEHLQRYL